MKCEYKRCDFIRNTSSDLEINIKKKHTINESYKSPMSTIEVQCMHCDEYFLEDGNFAYIPTTSISTVMIVYTTTSICLEKA